MSRPCSSPSTACVSCSAAGWAESPGARQPRLAAQGGGKHWQTWQPFSVTRQFSPKRQPLARLPPSQKGTLTAAVVALFVVGGSPVVVGSPAQMRGEQAPRLLAAR